MKKVIINVIMQGMLKHLDNSQMKMLYNVLERSFEGIEISKTEFPTDEQNINYIDLFVSAKRVEGCSEKTLHYYSQTIKSVIDYIGKEIPHITTEDLRHYITNYQEDRKSSKVTIDNIRRILSSFFAWLEDEDYIVKSPVRRIHKVKSAITIKETYTDENLEQMRDNCDELRDLALIDILASTGMRIG